MFQSFTKIRAALLLILASFCALSVSAQTAEYRSALNKMYWKNKLPYLGYWQQDVHYKIDANIDETTDIITGSETLVYYNNSPDTLHELFFHLYQNAFQPESYLHYLQEANGVNPTYGKYEASKQGITIEKIQISDNPAIELKTEVDNTILKVKLPTDLLPNDSIKLNINFRTFYERGSTRRRMKMYDAWGFKHYNGC
ncbi:MAG TPA: hypothetical protein PL084_09705, partial [Chitinophagales bacterium]|nr:hypothetical protein [Chitinophagales bacterium]